MVFLKTKWHLLVVLLGSTVEGLLHDLSYGSPYQLNSIVHNTAYVPALSHYQTHIRHGPTFRQIRASRPDWFDPTIPAFQTTLYAPAVHHANHFGLLDGFVRSFRQHIPLTNAPVVAPALGPVLHPDLGLHPAIRNALPYTPAVIHAPSVVQVAHEPHVISVGDPGVHLDPYAPASFYGHSYGGFGAAALYSARKKA